MANTYTWNCKTVEVYPTYESLDDVVYVVNWRLLATSSETHVVDGEPVPYTSTTYSTQFLSLADVGTDFIPFADLTNEVITGWTEAAIGTDEVQKFKDHLDMNITKQIPPTSETQTIGA